MAYSEPTPTLARRKHLSAWKTIGIALGVLVGAGTVAGAIGRAFYVTRDEYTENLRKDAIDKTSISKTLENLNHTMSDQKSAFHELSQAANQIQIDIAAIQARTSRSIRRREQ